MNTQPFKAALKMFAAIKAAMELPVHLQRTALADIGPYGSRGKGGKRPRHTSVRFVAQDKRDAQKARNKR